MNYFFESLQKEILFASKELSAEIASFKRLWVVKSLLKPLTVVALASWLVAAFLVEQPAHPSKVRPVVWLLFILFSITWPVAIRTHLQFKKAPKRLSWLRYKLLEKLSAAKAPFSLACKEKGYSELCEHAAQPLNNPWLRRALNMRKDDV